MKTDPKQAQSLVSQEVVAGLLCILCGVALLVLGHDLPKGTALRMGPGYVPMLLSWGLILLGVANIAQGMLGQVTPLQRWHPGIVLRIMLAMAAFAAFIQPAGVIAASALTVLIAQVDGLRTRPLEVILLALTISLAVTGIFVVGLDLPIHALPGE